MVMFFLTGNVLILFDRKASNILNTVFMEQHHRKQRQELESEMKVELERSKEELNQQLENELQAELEVSQTQHYGDSQTPKQLTDSQFIDWQLNLITHW